MGADTASSFLLPEIPRPTYDPAVHLDVERWHATDGERVMLLYGELDQWSARPFELGQARDSFFFTAPGGNHASGIGSLASADQQRAIKALERWLNTRYAPMSLAPPRTIEERRRRLTS